MEETENVKCCVFKVPQYIILGGCLLISCLHVPGKALRTLVDITRLAERYAFSKPSLVNLISKDTDLVFYLSV